MKVEDIHLSSNNYKLIILIDRNDNIIVMHCNPPAYYFNEEKIVILKNFLKRPPSDFENENE